MVLLTYKLHNVLLDIMPWHITLAHYSTIAYWKAKKLSSYFSLSSEKSVGLLEILLIALSPFEMSLFRWSTESLSRIEGGSDGRQISVLSQMYMIVCLIKNPMMPHPQLANEVCGSYLGN